MGAAENCLVIWQENGSWGDYVCMWTLPLTICEKPTTKPKSKPTPPEQKGTFA